MLSDNPTKAEELAHWQEFLATLPPCSYLALYLHGSTELLQRAMSNDESTELIPALRRGRQEALADMAAANKAAAEARETREAVKRDVLAAKRELHDCREELRNVRDAAASLLRSSEAAYAKAVHDTVRHAS